MAITLGRVRLLEACWEEPLVPLAGNYMDDPNSLPSPSRAIINSLAMGTHRLTRIITEVRIMASPRADSPVHLPVITLRIEPQRRMALAKTQ